MRIESRRIKNFFKKVRTMRLKIPINSSRRVRSRTTKILQSQPAAARLRANCKNICTRTETAERGVGIHALVFSQTDGSVGKVMAKFNASDRIIMQVQTPPHLSHQGIVSDYLHHWLALSVSPFSFSLYSNNSINCRTNRLSCCIQTIVFNLWGQFISPKGHRVSV